MTLCVPTLSFGIFISFILLPLSTFTFFNVSYVWKPPTHCQPSIFLCFQALFKTHYLNAPLLTYPIFVHAFLFLNIFHVLCCPKLTFERSSCLEPCLILLFFAKCRTTNHLLNLLGCVRISCGSISLLTASS